MSIIDKARLAGIRFPNTDDGSKMGGANFSKLPPEEQQRIRAELDAIQAQNIEDEIVPDYKTGFDTMSTPTLVGDKMGIGGKAYPGEHFPQTFHTEPDPEHPGEVKVVATNERIDVQPPDYNTLGNAAALEHDMLRATDSRHDGN